MHRQNYLAFFSIKQIELDGLCIVAAYFLSYQISCFFLPMDGAEVYIWLLVVFLPFWLLFMFIFRMYDETTFQYTDRIINSAILAAGISGIIVCALLYAVRESMFSMLMYCLFILTSTLLVVIQRLSLVMWLNKKHRYVSNVLVIGRRDLYEKFLYYSGKTQVRFSVTGFIPLLQVRFNEEDSFIDDEALLDFIKTHIVDEVIFALPRDMTGRFEKYIRQFEEMGITVRMLLDLYDPKLAKIHVSSIGTIPMVTFHTVSLNTLQLSIKRCMDILGALAGFALTLFLGVFIATAIKLESKGPVIFCQKRVGARGRIFKCYKFRSMYIDAEERKKDIDSRNQIPGGLMFKVRDDPRVTKVGRFLRMTSLDELPQFYNVLKGDMSLVGTRPPTLGEVEKYKIPQRRRISIKPGITGMWQTNGRSTISDFDEVVRLDISYIDNWSIWLDLKILLKTLVVVFQRTGAF